MFIDIYDEGKGVYIMEYSVLKKKEILPFATTQVNLEDTRPGEMSQSQKDKYCLISFTPVI